MRPQYRRFVELSNQGARELGFADTGALWRARYDMPPEAFRAELDRLWQQVPPALLSLHTYVRKKLREHYGAASYPRTAPSPLTCWATCGRRNGPIFIRWSRRQDADTGYDLTAILKSRKTEPLQMVRYGESFFDRWASRRCPQTFWQRSLFVKPRDREVVCHASAWDVDFVDDLRLKMCIEINDEDFRTIHHELGHNFYQRAYTSQPFLFRDSANDGFHEAIGDTIALSVTPEYLVKHRPARPRPGCLARTSVCCCTKALEKIAFLPFGLMIDKWRWKVFSGEIPPEQYNQAWWELR